MEVRRRLLDHPSFAQVVGQLPPGSYPGVIQIIPVEAEYGLQELVKDSALLYRGQALYGSLGRLGASTVHFRAHLVEVHRHGVSRGQGVGEFSVPARGFPDRIVVEVPVQPFGA